MDAGPGLVGDGLADEGLVDDGVVDGREGGGAPGCCADNSLASKAMPMQKANRLGWNFILNSVPIHYRNPNPHRRTIKSKSGSETFTCPDRTAFTKLLQAIVQDHLTSQIAYRQAPKK